MHTQGQFIDFLQKVFGEGTLSNQGNNISVVCPICQAKKQIDYRKRKLVIRTDNCLLHCWVCNYKAKNLLDILTRYGKEHIDEYVKNFLQSEQLDFENKNTIVEESKIVLPNDFELLATADRNNPNVKKYIKYLKFRGLGKVNLDKDLWYWKFGFSSEENYINRIIMPSFDEEGNLNYFTARTINPKIKPKYVNPPVKREEIIFNEININWKKPLVIVEGPFDLVKCTDNSTCLLGSDLNHNYKLFHKIVRNKTPIILALDPDAIKKQDKIAKDLFSWDIPIQTITIPQKYSDVGEMTEEEFISQIKSATIFNIETSLRSKIARII